MLGNKRAEKGGKTRREGTWGMFELCLELLNVPGIQDHICAVVSAFLCLEPKAQVNGCGQELRMELRPNPSGARKSRVSHSQRGQCRFSNYIYLQLGKLLILASHKRLKQEVCPFC